MENRIDLKAFANGSTENQEKSIEPVWNVPDFRANPDVEGSEKVSTTNVEVRKPQKQEWFRAHSTLQFPASVLEINASGNVFLVHPSLPHLITLSARKSRDCGIVTPICLAVIRFTTSSYLVGRSTGSSAGLVPFRILPASTPMRRN
jgi:hypothetical protein